jgi:adenosine deaminase
MLTFKQNEIIINKAIKYRSQGIIGMDLAGPNRASFSMKQHKSLFDKARKAGLGLTVHTGEEKQLAEMKFIVNEIRPQRIGHGVECVKDKKLMQKLVEHNITLEVCPTSNLRNSVVKNTRELKSVIRTFLKNRVKFAICTDGPEMYRTNIAKEQKFLKDNGILNERELDQCTKWAFEASFIK